MNDIIGDTRTIRPLTKVTGDLGGFTLTCRECGDVTMQESGGYVDKGTMQQVGLYRQRHLSRHLTALATEVAEATR